MCYPTGFRPNCHRSGDRTDTPIRVTRRRRSPMPSRTPVSLSSKERGRAARAPSCASSREDARPSGAKPLPRWAPTTSATSVTLPNDSATSSLSASSRTPERKLFFAAPKCRLSLSVPGGRSRTREGVRGQRLKRVEDPDGRSSGSPMTSIGARRLYQQHALCEYGQGGPHEHRSTAARRRRRYLAA